MQRFVRKTDSQRHQSSQVVVLKLDASSEGKLEDGEKMSDGDRISCDEGMHCLFEVVKKNVFCCIQMKITC